MPTYKSIFASSMRTNVPCESPMRRALSSSKSALGATSLDARSTGSDGSKVRNVQHRITLPLTHDWLFAPIFTQGKRFPNELRSLGWSLPQFAEKAARSEASRQPLPADYLNRATNPNDITHKSTSENNEANGSGATASTYDTTMASIHTMLPKTTVCDLNDAMRTSDVETLTSCTQSYDDSAVPAQSGRSPAIR